jgi:hypothetical protein
MTNELAFIEFLEEALKWKPEPLTLHQCCVIMPTRIVEAHEQAGCPGKSPHYEDTVQRLTEFNAKGEDDARG